MNVILYEKNRIGMDEFNRPIEDLPEVVPDVLVEGTDILEVLDTLNITGKKLVYTLAIPKRIPTTGRIARWNSSERNSGHSGNRLKELRI